MCGRRPFAIVFYETSHGDKPVLRWIKEDLSVRQRCALGYAVYRLLQRYGVSICYTESALVRVFCHAAGDRVILLLGGYDKGKDYSRRRQDREIKVARRRLTEYLRRHRDVDRDSPGLERL